MQSGFLCEAAGVEEQQETQHVAVQQLPPSKKKFQSGGGTCHSKVKMGSRLASER